MMMAVRISVLCLSLSPTFSYTSSSPNWVGVGIGEKGRGYVESVEHHQQMSLQSTPNRSKSAGERVDNAERPRSFDAKAKNLCWAKADTVPGRHPERWRKDVAGNIVCRRFFNCLGCLCFEYDHIIPYSKGGDSTADNCQILQTRVNRFKSNQESVDRTLLEGYSCDVKFTDKELDVIEMGVYGDVLRPGKECRCRTVAEMLGQHKSKDKKEACKLP